VNSKEAYTSGRGKNGARKRTRTSTTVRPLAPEASASASSAIRAQGNKTGKYKFEAGVGVCQRNGEVCGGKVRMLECPRAARGGSIYGRENLPEVRRRAGDGEVRGGGNYSREEWKRADRKGGQRSLWFAGVGV
jgi:hypothetical protein